MSEYDLVLHVGMPRSGAVLRKALDRLRPQLRTHRVAFVGGPQIEGLRHVAGWEGGRPSRRQDASAFGRELAAAVAAERRNAAGIRGRLPVRTLVSSNRLLGTGAIGLRDAEQFRPHAARATAQIIEALSAHRVQVVLYTHR